LVGWLVSSGTKLTLIRMIRHCRLQNRASPILHGTSNLSQLSGQVRAKTNQRVVGMDPMAK